MRDLSAVAAFLWPHYTLPLADDKVRACVRAHDPSRQPAPRLLAGLGSGSLGERQLGERQLGERQLGGAAGAAGGSWWDLGELGPAAPHCTLC